MARAGVFSAACLVVLCLLAGHAAAYRGDGTAYSGDYQKDKTGFNSCGFGKLSDVWEKYYAALPSQVFNRASDCGRCIKVRGTDGGATGKWVKAMVVDECASCNGNGDVDLSTRALQESTGFSWDRKGIEWDWTSCSGSADSSSSSRSNNDKSAADKQEEERQKRWEERKQQEEEQARRDAEQAEREEEDRRQKRQQAEEEQQAADEAEARRARRVERERQEASAAEAAAEAEAGTEPAPEAAADPTAASAGAEATAAVDEAGQAAAATAAAGGEAQPRKLNKAEDLAAQPTAFTDWVVACEGGRPRCPHLQLAARGYQCMNRKRTGCCRTGNGLGCYLLDIIEDTEAAPEGWTGRDLVESSSGTSSSGTSSSGSSSEAAAPVPAAAAVDEAADNDDAAVAAAPSDEGTGVVDPFALPPPSPVKSKPGKKGKPAASEEEAAAAPAVQEPPTTTDTGTDANTEAPATAEDSAVVPPADADVAAPEPPTTDGEATSATDAEPAPTPVASSRKLLLRRQR